MATRVIRVGSRRSDPVIVVRSVPVGDIAALHDESQRLGQCARRALREDRIALIMDEAADPVTPLVLAGA